MALKLYDLAVADNPHRRRPSISRLIFSCEITLEDCLDGAQRQRLLEIAQRCPAHETPDRGAKVQTRVADALATPTLLAARPRDHMDAMIQARQPGAA